MDEATRGDIHAAAAAHRELGRDYDDAVAESLVDRIGAEIDKRIDARLGTRPSEPRSPAGSSQSGRSQAPLLAGVAFGSGLTGIVAIIANHGLSPSTTKSVIWIWLLLTVIGLGSVLMRKYVERK